MSKGVDNSKGQSARHKRVRAAMLFVAAGYLPALILLALAIAGCALASHGLAELMRHDGPASPLAVWLLAAEACVGAILTAAALRLLWTTTIADVEVRLPEDAVEVRRAEAPELFRHLDAIATACGVTPLDQILIGGNCNAAIARSLTLWPARRSPRLLVGLPLLDALTPEEFGSVVAHEFGHLKCDSLWIDALARAVTVVSRMEPIAASLGLAWLTDRWHRHVRHLQLALARDGETAADAMALKVCGAEIVAQALVRVTIIIRVEAEIRRREIERALRARVRGDLLLQRWQRRFEKGRARTGLLHAALVWRTRSGDSHPALADRLAFINAPVRLPAPVLRPASLLLGSSRDAIRDRLQALKAASAMAMTGDRASTNAWIRERFVVLAPAVGRGDRLAILESAELAWRIGHPVSAVAPLRLAIETVGPWPRLVHRLAVCLAEVGDEEGFWRMLDLADGETRYASDAAAWLAERYARDGDLENASRFERRHALLARRQARRSASPIVGEVVVEEPTNIARGLVAACFDAVRCQAPDVEQVGWLAAARERNEAEPGCLLVVEALGPVRRRDDGAARQMLGDMLRLLPFDVTIVDPVDTRCRHLAKRIKKFGALVPFGEGGEVRGRAASFDVAFPAAAPAIP